MIKYFYRLKWFILKCYKAGFWRFFKIRVPINVKYNGQVPMTGSEANEYIYQVLSGEPKDGFFAGRFGSNEMLAFAKFDPNIGSMRNGEKVLKRFCNGAGFFPETKEAARKFAEEMQRACKQIDLIAIWNNPMEDYAMKIYADDVKYSRLVGLEPYYYNNPWSRVLVGKKVLVIHPFVDSIRKQYENNREKLFKNPDVLPEFELITLKAVQTIAGNRDERFADWFEALQYMEEEALKLDFDVAIVGCGAYGFPLCARLKEHGKIAIHMGGATQMMFGVKGSRWEKMPVFNNIINEHWIRPSEEETPKNTQSVEEACYW